MFVKVKNNNYGYAVATYGDYVVVSNPDFLRWTNATASTLHTGSVDVFLYNKSTNEHDFMGTLHQTWRDIPVLLDTEANNPISASSPLATESSSLVPYPKYDIKIDENEYAFSLDNSFGQSLDMYEKMLVIGSPYLTEMASTNAFSVSQSWSMVEIYDLARTEWTAQSSSAAVYSIDSPEANTGSFGWAVSINKDWIAVGSPYYSGSKGTVYLYRNTSTNDDYSWTLFQQIEPSGAVDQSLFGWSLKLNKADTQYSHSLVVGCGNIGAGAAYLFEFNGTTWKQTYTFTPDYTVMPMTFNPDYMPYYNVTMNTYNGFGQSVSCYDDSVIIGEPYDRMFCEYSGSSLYQQGSVSIFERCKDYPQKFQQVFKSYGTPNTLYNNTMGWSVDMFNGNAVAGVTKIDVEDMTTCYIEGTLNQLHYCDTDLQTLVTGQSMLIQKNTGSGQWGVTNVYQKKKKYLSPYRDYGYSVAIADTSMVIGSPMYLADDNREINIETTQSSNMTLDAIAGKAYIYNLNNLRDKFHVGNAFYRNGKIIVMTSGSVFDGLFYNPINSYTYEYDLEFKSQHTILEKQIICTVDPGEFNVSTNPTAVVRAESILDINKNGKFDYQDLDVILRYMQYKNTSILGVPVSMDWSSSIVTTEDEISLLKYLQSQTDNSTTPYLVQQTLEKWETTDTQMQTILDFNQDSRIDVRDMNILWKYFSNRLTQANYSSYVTPSSHRRLFSDVMDYLNGLSQRFSKPVIKSDFLDYERLSTYDKTGSYVAPMATTIGLYDGLNLVAVAKLGTPIKITPELPINFVVKLDF